MPSSNSFDIDVLKSFLTEDNIKKNVPIIILLTVFTIYVIFESVQKSKLLHNNDVLKSELLKKNEELATKEEELNKKDEENKKLVMVNKLLRDMVDGDPYKKSTKK